MDRHWSKPQTFTEWMETQIQTDTGQEQSQNITVQHPDSILQ